MDWESIFFKVVFFVAFLVAIAWICTVIFVGYHFIHKWW